MVPTGSIPARTPAFEVRSGGHRLPGVLHLPRGRGPHPAVLLLHGFPGYERNFDLAQVLRRAGFATLVFHYRGSWGAAGDWSWRTALEDSTAAVAALRAAPEIDSGKVVIIGHSFGGFAALQTAAADPSIKLAASITCFDLGAAGVAVSNNQAGRRQYADAFAQQLLPLSGTTGEALADEMVANSPDWRLADLAPRLKDRPVLLIGASLDTDAPYEQHHLPLVEAYRGPHFEEHLFATDHALSDHREQLATTVLAFLRASL